MGSMASLHILQRFVASLIKMMDMSLFCAGVICASAI